MHDLTRPSALLCSAVLLAAVSISACQREAQPQPDAGEAAAPATAPTEAPATEADRSDGATIDDSIMDQSPEPDADNRVPQVFHGTFDESAQACSERSEARLVIDAEQLRFHENTGTVERVQVSGDNQITLRLAMQGEGERWQATERFALSADGNELYDEGQSPAFVRVRCR